MKFSTALTIISLALCSASAASADSFGSGANAFDIDFVTIGNPDNIPDTTGNPSPPYPTGSVGYVYRMGKYEISEDMINKANTLGELGITHANRGANKPAYFISWFEAVKFVNWLNTSTGHTPAYNFDGGGNFQLWQSGDAGYDANNHYRNSLAHYFLPSVDEWYKAAYYDPSGVYYNYPTGSDTAPSPVLSGTTVNTAVYHQYDQPFGTGPADITLAGGLSPYGTMGQGGNVCEWEETDFDLVNDSTSFGRGVRGGDYFLNTVELLSSNRYNGDDYPANDYFEIGFRVASIPEPSSLLLGALTCLGLIRLKTR